MSNSETINGQQRVTPAKLLSSYKTKEQAQDFRLRCIEETSDTDGDGHKVGGTMAAWLDNAFPVRDFPERALPNGEELTGLEYALMDCGIKTRNIPQRGIYSSHIRAFLDAEPASVNYALFAEYVAFQQTVALPLAPDQLSQVVKTTVPFSGPAFQIPYISDSVTDRRMVRISQGSEIPLAAMPYNSRPVTPFTYGKGLEITYQALRRSAFTVEVFGLEVQRIALQARIDRMRAAADVAINGDTQYGGASGAATSTNLTTLDSGTSAGIFTYKAYNAMMPLGQNDANGWYQWDTVIGNAASLTILANMTGLPTGFLAFVNLPAGPQQNNEVAFIRPAGIYNPLVMINNPDAPANIITLLDSRWALIEGVEQGGDITENERMPSNQTLRTYVTQSIATGVWHQGARQTINLGA